MCKGKGKFEFKIVYFSREIQNREMVPIRYIFFIYSFYKAIEEGRDQT